MRRLLFVFGTRPEAIKLAPLIRETRRRSGFEVVVCVTGQHREMLDQVLDVFGIVPDVDLQVMRPDQTLFDITADVLRGLEGVLHRFSPDLVIVQGDTTTALAGALAAYYARTPVAHVEAGLRTGDKYSPYPEEMNRALVDVLSDVHLAPTEHARCNLLQAGIESDRIHVTGNTVIDALLWARDRIEASGSADAAIGEQLSRIPRGLRERIAEDAGRRLIVVTGHRRESFGPDFEAICHALRLIAERNPEVELAYAVHLNPAVRTPVYRILDGVDRVHLFDPPPYLAFVWLLTRCRFVLTDSGGIQEEAPSLGKPLLVMRRVTERPEGVEAGCARVVGVGTDDILSAAERLLHDEEEYARMSNVANPYGDGTASAQTADILWEWLRAHV